MRRGGGGQVLSPELKERELVTRADFSHAFQHFLLPLVIKQTSRNAHFNKFHLVTYFCGLWLLDAHPLCSFLIFTAKRAIINYIRLKGEVMRVCLHLTFTLTENSTYSSSWLLSVLKDKKYIQQFGIRANSGSHVVSNCTTLCYSQFSCDVIIFQN